MLNQCNFIGNLGNDPEIRYAASGTTIANISIACSHKYKDEEHTEWVRGVAFGKLAEIIGEYLRKGSQVFISGRMQTKKWEDKDGNNRYTTEIVINDMKMLGNKSGGSNATPSSDSSGSQPEQAAKPTAASNDFDDDIPF